MTRPTLTRSSRPARLALALLCIAILAAPAPAAPEAGPATAPATSPGHWWLPTPERLRTLPPPAQVGLIVAGTLISEDVVCVAVGMGIRRHWVSPAVGAAACFLGIYVGDLLFFLLGRLGGRRLLATRFATRGLGPERLKAFGDWFDKRPYAAIAACRVLPGLRVPLYLAVGGLSTRTVAFFAWTAFFAFVWTPVLIGLVWVFGDAFVRPFEWFTGGGGWVPVLLGIAAMVVAIRLAMSLATRAGRAKLLDKVGRLWGRKPTRATAGAAEGTTTGGNP